MKDLIAIEEVLERLWTADEEGMNLTVDQLIKEGFDEPDKLLGSMVEQGMVQISGESIVLSDKGRWKARMIIRQHRLAECLFSEVLLLNEEDVESTACHLEHIINPNVMASVCTFLGHPTRCPHGKEIPPGECCSKFSREVKPLVCPLSEITIGARCRIVFIHPKTGARLDRLSALGVNPGSMVRVKQRNPSYVVEISETLLALDREIADLIYVKRNDIEANGEESPAINNKKKRWRWGWRRRAES
ncbi:metal-dependent transcriptional regulator [Acidobacteriota bacterium]